MTFVSYAQNFEDVMLWRALAPVVPGFYIDVGAHHPDIDSVTRAFYDRGWSGINVEPVPEHARRLKAARWRDVTLQVALGAAPGQAVLEVVGDTGLSTLDGGIAGRHRDAGWSTTGVEVALDTLAAVCARHVSGPIHFLKIDVEGAERDVLLGADFSRWRPWIVLVEATAPNSTEQTHAAWEDLLVAAEYDFAWFDGLNRFYVAHERAEALLPHFRVPPNVFDNFVRTADTRLAGEVAAAQTELAQLRKRLERSEARAAASFNETAVERGLSDLRGQEVARMERVLSETYFAHADQYADWQRQTEALNRYIVDQGRLLDGERAAAQAAQAAAQAARTLLDATLGSTSWRMTAPLRRAVGLLRPAVPLALPAVPAEPDRTPPAPPPAPAARPLPALPAPRPPRTGLRAVHQFHSGTAVGDAVTNGMLLVRGILRAWGYRSDIFAQYLDPALGGEVRPMAELPRRADHVLLVHHSMGHTAFDTVAALPAPKVLVFHNITPPEFLEPESLRDFARLGREQLARLAPLVVASLGDSEYNAVEMRRAGFDAPEPCTLLFDPAAWLARAAAAPPRAGGEPFTVLFVGRVCEAKAQAELLAAFARFHAAFGAPARLVLAGRHGGEDDPYVQSLRGAIDTGGLNGCVRLAGLVDDAELHGLYAAADLYVSLSRHEGFGVPLAEAMAYGIPVLAWPAAAVPYTLGGASPLLDSRATPDVAAAMLRLAHDPAERAAVAARQRTVLEGFALDRHTPALGRALARAGAAPPMTGQRRAALDRAVRFTVTGHASGTYSLAAVNRTLALALDGARPGRVRLCPVEGEPSALRDVPEADAARLHALAARPPHESAPVAVISQHYPVLVPADRGDVLLAYFFWEESVVPPATVRQLNAGFGAVLAPSAFVAKVLVDSGVSVPVFDVGFAPALDAFATMPRRRAPGAMAEGTFTFLHVSSCFPRKGVDVLLRAYAAAFRAGDPVRLVVKGFPNPHNDVADQVARLRATDPGAPEVTLLDQDLDGDALRALFAGADAMVLPTRGEGFNIPAAEAMAAGVPLIVTGHGGHTGFCSADTADIVPFRFGPSGSHLATAGSVWAEPDPDALAAAMRRAVTERREGAARAQRARAAAATLADGAAWARRVADAALDASLASRSEPLRSAWITTWNVRCGIAEYSRHLVEAVLRAHGGALEGTLVLCDDRSEVRAEPAGLEAVPGWILRKTGSLDRLAAAVEAADPDAVVIQHQPGVIGWSDLAIVLRHSALAGRTVVVTLHNTRHLLKIEAGERRTVLKALRGCARVAVHAVADLNLLLSLDAAANAVLVPHGAVPRAGAAGMDRILVRGPPPPDGGGPMQDGPRQGGPIQGGPILGSYGFFLPGKGIDTLIEAAGDLSLRWPGLTLRLVNADYGTPESTAEIERCRTLAAAAGLDVEWHTGFLPHGESLALLAGCDAIVLPYASSLEATSAALRTALAAGPPVAVTPLPLFDEAGDAVFRFAGLDRGAVAEGLDAMLADAGRRATLRDAGAAWLAARDWAVVGERFGGMLRGLVRAAG